MSTLRPREVLREMGVHASRVRFVSGRRNAHWIVDTPGGRTVLRRYAPDRTRADVDYDLALVEHLDRRRWPVPVPVAPVVSALGSLWCLFRYIPGRKPVPRTASGIEAESLSRGRLLARLHQDMAPFAALGQRPGWRRADEWLWDRTGRPPVQDVLRKYARTSPEGGRVLLAYHDAARARLDELLPHAPEPVVVHGDLTPWNMRYLRGRLSGILDFDAAHLDLRVADFALAWRGRHDAVVRGYEEVSTLEPVERELIVPVYWAWVVASAVGGIDAGHVLDSWAVDHLLRIPT